LDYIRLGLCFAPKFALKFFDSSVAALSVFNFFERGRWEMMCVSIRKGVFEKCFYIMVLQ